MALLPHALFCGWHCFLRSAEMIDLSMSKISLNQQFIGSISLGLTKAGKRRGAAEMVTVTSPAVGFLLQFAGKLVEPSGPLIGCTKLQFRHGFEYLLTTLQLLPYNFRLYSIRRGGATAHFSTYGDINSTIFKGRWSDLRTARIYITEGAAAQAELQLQKESHPKLRYYSSVFEKFLATYHVPVPLDLSSS